MLDEGDSRTMSDQEVAHSCHDHATTEEPQRICFIFTDLPPEVRLAVYTHYLAITSSKPDAALDARGIDDAISNAELEVIKLFVNSLLNRKLVYRELLVGITGLVVRC